MARVLAVKISQIPVAAAARTVRRAAKQRAAKTAKRAAKTSGDDGQLSVCSDHSAESEESGEIE